jgi:hypothetical protein
MRCPNPTCNHPGPLGFSDPSPWGLHFYHDSGCPGMWLYRDAWYATEAAAWTQYKQDGQREGRRFDADWLLAFDARLLHQDERKYRRYIKRWSAKYG